LANEVKQIDKIAAVTTVRVDVLQTAAENALEFARGHAERIKVLESLLEEKEKNLQRQIDEIKKERDDYRSRFRWAVGILVGILLALVSALLRFWPTSAPPH
jgi:hypothetical protein